MGPMDDGSWMGSIQRTLHGFGQFSQLLDGSYFSMNDSFSSLMEFLHVIGELRHHVLFIVKAIAGLMLLQVTGRSVKEYLGWRGGSSNDDLASFRHFSQTKKQPSIWPKVALIAGLLAVFGPYLYRYMFNAKTAKKIPARKLVVVYDYKAETEEELPLRTGDLIIVDDDRSNPEWWRGHDEKGNKGFFPSSFCELLLDDLDDEENNNDEEDDEIDEEERMRRKKRMEIVKERRKRDRESQTALTRRNSNNNNNNNMPHGTPNSMRRSMYNNNNPNHDPYMEDDMVERRLSYSTPNVY
jgi:hypothetical protein